MSTESKDEDVPSNSPERRALKSDLIKSDSMREIATLIASYVPVICIRSFEESRARKFLRRLTIAQERLWVEWTVTHGAVCEPDNDAKLKGEFKDCNEPLRILGAAYNFMNVDPSDDRVKKRRKINILLKDFHPYFDGYPQVIRAIKDLMPLFRRHRATLLLLTCDGKLPVDLEKDVPIVDFNIPNRDQLKTIKNELVSLAKSLNNVNRPKDDDEDKVIDAVLGLTAQEAEAALARSIVVNNRLSVDEIVTQKKAIIRQSGLLEYVDWTDSLSDVGGADNLKIWLAKRRYAYTDEASRFGLSCPKGILLVGPPGCLHPDTDIFDPTNNTNKSVRQRFLEQQPFHVWALDHYGLPVITAACLPVCGPKTTMLRFRLSNGRNITVTPNHRFQTPSGFAPACEIYERHQRGVACHLLTSSESALSAHAQDALRWIEIAPDFRSGCLLDYRSCDAQLHRMSNIDRDVAPSPNGGVQPQRASLAAISVNTVLDDGERLLCTTLGSPYGYVSPRQEPSKHLQYAEKTIPSREPPQREVYHPNTFPLPASYDHPSSAWSTSSYTNYQVTEEAEILQVDVLDTSEYFDFHVPVLNNYWAQGVWNHNCGKTLLARAVASDWKQPLIKLDIGRLFDSYVGSSEGNMRRAIQFAESIAPTFLIIDEMEKGMSGIQSSGVSDSGTTARVFGTFLNWMQDKKVPVFVIGCVNNINVLPPEFCRKGRFDEIFSIDLPTESERAEIFNIHLRKRNRDAKSLNINVNEMAKITPGYTGAEIEQIILEAMFDAWEQRQLGDTAADISTSSLRRAIKNIIPISKTMRDEIEKTRSWAVNRARPASNHPREILVGSGLESDDDVDL